MKVAVIGSGREHAICLSLKNHKSKKIDIQEMQALIKLLKMSKLKSVTLVNLRILF